jgi:hypothetical protein
MRDKSHIVKIVSIISFIIALSATSYSQDFRAGVQLGITGTQVTGDQLAGFNKAGLFGGFFVNRDIGNLGDGQLEINFIQKGSRKNAHPDKGDYVKYLLRLNYVEVPVMYRFRIKNFLKIEAGVMFAYLINTKEFDIQGQVIPDPTVAGFKKYDLSAFAGLNYKINDKLSLSLRYSYSVLAIRPKPNSVTYRYDSGQFNEVVCTSLQYNFN